MKAAAMLRQAGPQFRV